MTKSILSIEYEGPYGDIFTETILIAPIEVLEDICDALNNEGFCMYDGQELIDIIERFYALKEQDKQYLVDKYADDEDDDKDNPYGNIFKRAYTMQIIEI